MRKIFLTAAAIAGFAACGALLPNSASAMTISTPAAVQHAVDGKSVAEQVRYVCSRVWTGWGWRRSCWWRPNHYSYRVYPRYHRHHYYRYGYRY